MVCKSSLNKAAWCFLRYSRQKGKYLQVGRPEMQERWGEQSGWNMCHYGVAALIRQGRIRTLHAYSKYIGVSEMEQEELLGLFRRRAK